MNLDHAEVFVALAIPGIAALWRSASLRSDMRKEWSPRVEDAEVGLTDRATNELLGVQQEIASQVGSGSASVPRLATLDPGLLADRIHEFQKTMKTINRLQAYFKWLLRIGPALSIAAGLFLIGVAALFANNSDLTSSEALRIGGLAMGIAGVAFGILIFAGWEFLQLRLSGAELRASENPS